MPEKPSRSRESEKTLGWRDANEWPEIAARLCRVDARIPNRVDRIECLGNSVSPYHVYPILKAIAEIEKGGII